jgi:S-adenosylmethionine:tRNA ribosyltransferase-isomerase
MGRKGSAPSIEERPEQRTPRTGDFDYPLPETLIADRPAPRRDASRLLVVDREREQLEDHRFPDLRNFLADGDMLVLNDTRVFPARLLGRKSTGARAEVFLLHPVEEPTGSGPTAGAHAGPEADAAPARWEAIVRPGGKLKPGRRVVVGDSLEIEIEDSIPGGGRVVRLIGDGDPWELIERFGQVPLPPYIRRAGDAADVERYQTVYARHRGSVAAPTAGLHFTRPLLNDLEADGVRLLRITLHVGIGTFRPVDVEDPREHRLQAERYHVDPETAAALNAARQEGRRICAVGTTACRTLESAVGADGRFRSGEGQTDLFIFPPYEFKAVDLLITNFHLPRSSLLMLVTALAGHDLTMRAYRHAVAERYRFYSYGDAMLVV